LAKTSLARVKKIFLAKKNISAKNFFAERKKILSAKNSSPRASRQALGEGEEFFTESKPAGSRRRNSSPRVFLLLSAKKF
jgi:hypothetical protein